jgi:hypothetical protein
MGIKVYYFMSDLNELLEFHITKAVLGENGQMQWASTASDVHPDVFNEKMSLELYNSFIENYKAGTPNRIFVSLSHYPEFNGLGNAGEVTHLYMDGDKLKAKGIFYDNPLGKAIFNAIKADKINKVAPENRIRVSIGFYATKMQVGERIWRYGDNTDIPVAKNGEIKTYKAGILEHLAVTRKPANRRADINIIDKLTEKSEMTLTRKDDALSIVGNSPEAVAIVDELENKLKSQPVTKSNEPELVEKDQNVAAADIVPAGTFDIVNSYDSGSLRQKLAKVIMSMLPDGSLTEDELSRKIDEMLLSMTAQSEVKQETITEAVPEVKKDMGEMDDAAETEKEDEWQPLGGAQTIGDAMKFIELEKLEDKLEQAFYLFGAVSNNIMCCDDDIMLKMKNMGQLFTDFRAMLRPDALMKLAEYEKTPMAETVSKPESQVSTVNGENQFWQPIVQKMNDTFLELATVPTIERRERLQKLMSELVGDIQNYDAEIEKRATAQSGTPEAVNQPNVVTMETLQAVIQQINGAVDNKLAAYNEGLTSQISQLTQLVQQSIVARSNTQPQPMPMEQHIPAQIPVQKSVTYAPQMPVQQAQSAGKPMSIRDFARKSVFLG